MRSQRKRVAQLESQSQQAELPALEITKVNSKEQVQHPERFNKVLDEVETYESGITRKLYHLERKNRK